MLDGSPRKRVLPSGEGFVKISLLLIKFSLSQHDKQFFSKSHIPRSFPIPIIVKGGKLVALSPCVVNKTGEYGRVIGRGGMKEYYSTGMKP